MNKPFWKRSVSTVLALAALVWAVPVSAMAAQNRFTLIQLAESDVELEGTTFPYTGEEIRPTVTVRVQDTLLTQDQDYTLEYADNIEVGTGKVLVSGIATASENMGYTGTVEIPFEITAPAAYQLKDSDVAIEGTSFTYTGSYIEPKVTVTVLGKELVRDQHYALTYHSNIGVGTAIASVTGIESAGYTGQVNVSFTIEKDPEIPEFQLITLKGTDVTMEGTEFTHTGKAIEPKITVTVNGKELVRGNDYALTYENNVKVGTAYAIVRGIATASETIGYTGEVKIPFTIVEAKAPETTEPEATEPEATEPEATEPEATEPETVTYKVTKGDKSTWYTKSSKTLSFTANGAFKDFKGVQIDNKDLPEKYYTAKEGSTVITLKNEFLKKLGTGKHTITILFEDGQAEAAFKVAEGLDDTNPETGDTFPMGLWLTLMGTSAAGIIAVVVLRKKIFS